jgi:hypothetical protein
VIVYLPAALFALSLLVTYGSAGRPRQLATVVMVVSTAWSLLLLAEPAVTAWAIGPVAATLLSPRPGPRVGSSFEGLTRRSVTLVAALTAAIFFASRLPVQENPVLLSAVPWLLGAVGAAWFFSPIDQRERLQGQVLMVAAVAGVILAAAPAGILTSALAGCMALMPVAGERGRVPGRLRLALSGLLLLLAATAAIIAAIGGSIAAVVLIDLVLTVSSTILLGTAILLVAGAATTPIGMEWAAGLGVLALAAAAPGLRWAALAGLVGAATALEREGERPAWLAAGALALTTVLQVLATPSWSPRAQVVALACGLVLMFFAARTAILRVLVLPTTALVVVLTTGPLSAGNLVRFQWVAAVGAGLLVLRAALTWLIQDSRRREPLRDQLILALLLIAISAHDGLGLGVLAVVLLLIDLAVVRIDTGPASFTRSAARLVVLARSNWPPSVTFAGATIAVLASLQAGLVLGLLASAMLAALQLAPLIDGRGAGPFPERPRSPLRWIGPTLSIACGLAPGLLMRMLRIA